ncbi:MAG: O-antigen ligase family protein [Bacilli bacterium]|nr:O-antigen ligase family protein [Bacilli bacterium]
MNKINRFIESNIDKIILVFLFLNPFLDVLAGLQTHYLNISFSFSSVIRLIFMLLCIYYIFCLDNTVDKNINKKYLLVLFAYFILFSITTILYKDYNALGYEIKNTLNTFYFPVVLIALFDMFIQYKIKISLKQIIMIYFIYVLFVLIPDFFKVGFISYYHSKVGSVGWFISANAVGNILSLLMPFFAYYLINSKEHKIFKCILTIMLLIVLSDMGTKVPMLSLLIVMLFHLIYYLIEWIKNKETKKIVISIIATLVVVVSSIIMVPKTSFYKNIEIHKDFLGINHYYEVLTDYHLIDHFIFSQRLTFLSNTHKNYKESSVLEKISGIGYIEKYGTDSVSTKTIEIDYFEVFYRNGIIGFILFFYMIIKVVKSTLSNIKEKSLINLEFKTCYLLIILLALFSGHILVTPAVSIFVSLTLVMPFFKENFVK